MMNDVMEGYLHLVNKKSWKVGDGSNTEGYGNKGWDIPTPPLYAKDTLLLFVWIQMQR